MRIIAITPNYPVRNLPLGDGKPVCLIAQTPRGIEYFMVRRENNTNIFGKPHILKDTNDFDFAVKDFNGEIINEPDPIPITEETLHSVSDS